MKTITSARWLAQDGRKRGSLVATGRHTCHYGLLQCVTALGLSIPRPPVQDSLQGLEGKVSW